MKKLVLLVLLLLTQSMVVNAQEKVEKPSYVIIANDEIITQEKVQEYASKGLLKSMNKGVTQEKRDSLHTKLGDVIKDKELIIVIELRSEEEVAEQHRIASKSKKMNAPRDTFLLNIEDEAADFTVNMLNGKDFKLSDHKGKVVLLNFWATWCGPCIMEFAEIPDKILNKFSKEDFVFIPIAIGQKKETVAAKMPALKKYGVHFDVAYDTEAAIWHQYASGAIPKNFLIDKNGIIRLTSQGYTEASVDKIAAKIKKLVEE